jgi:hypothetical protein
MSAGFAVDAAHFDPVLAHHHVGAHLIERLGKLHVALDTAVPDPFDAHRAAANGAGREKIGCRRSVTFDRKTARRMVASSGGHLKTGPAVAFHFDPEPLHQANRDFDVRLGDQFAFDFDRGAVRSDQRQRHQKRRQELAGHVAAHTQRPFHGELSRMNRQGRKAVLA